MDLSILEIINRSADRAAHKTVMQLKAAGALKDNNSIIHREISKALRSYYQNGQENKDLENALDQLKDDAYIDIIPLYYYSGNTIEHIAAAYDVDISTITRNKKRLCYEIYELMGGSGNDKDDP